MNGLEEHLRPESCQAWFEFRRRFFRPDARASEKEHRPGVEPFVDQHGGDARLLVPARDRPLDGGGAAQPGEERAVDVDGAEGRDLDHAAGEDLPVGHDHLQLGREGAQRLLGGGLPHAPRLEHGDVAGDGHGLEGRGRQ